MELDIEITAIRRKSDRKVFAVGEQIGRHGNESISGFELEEDKGRVTIFVLSKAQSSDRVYKTALDKL